MYKDCELMQKERGNTIITRDPACNIDYSDLHMVNVFELKDGDVVPWNTFILMNWNQVGHA